MRDYNGFSGRQRQRAQNWLNREWDAGRLARPSKCVACGQTTGVIDARAEDYSDPFRAGVTDRFHFCRICHSMMRLRSTNPKAWSDYRAKIEAGGRAKVFKENQRYPGSTSKFVTTTCSIGEPAPMAGTPGDRDVSGRGREAPGVRGARARRRVKRHRRRPNLMEDGFSALRSFNERAHSHLGMTMFVLPSGFTAFAIRLHRGQKPAAASRPIGGSRSSIRSRNPGCRT
jgi:hypothetical protein